MPWKDPVHHFSRIPPHVAALHDLMVVRDEQRLLVDKFIDKMRLVLDERGIEGGHLTVQQLQEILGQGLNNIQLRLDEKEGGRLPRWAQEQEVVRDLGQPINNSTFTPHCHHGGFSGFRLIGAFQELVSLTCGDIGGLVILYGRYRRCGC
ncbi:hypothetical protein ACA910_022049 [Epithemia clementina (nom. ined.)]